MVSPYRSIGFIGLGVMGYPMARNLALKTNDAVSIHVFDVNATTVQQMQDENTQKIVSCKSSFEVAQNSDIIISMVPEGSHVRSVYLTPGTGVLAAELSGKIIIDCSTIDITTSKLISEKVKERCESAAFYDAPVSGGSLGAVKGTLTFMLGCKQDDTYIRTVSEVLATMGTSIFPCGGPTFGLLAKFCNNYCSGLIAIATAESMNIAICSGMDPRVLHSIFNTSTAGSTINKSWNPVPGICPEAPASHGYHGGFKIQLMRKDFALAVDAANQAGVRLVLGDAGLKTYTDASNDPACRDLDSRVIYRYLGGNEHWETKQGSG